MSTCSPSSEVSSSLSDARLRIDDAGGVNRRFVLAAEYLPRSGKKRKVIKSNYRMYGKSWASREEITLADKQEFVEWINSKLATGGGSRQRAPKASEMAMRSSMRMHDKMTSVRICGTDLVVELGVVQCVKYLVDNVVHAFRHGQRLNRVNYVPSKRRHKTATSRMEQVLQGPRWGADHLTSRMRRAAKRLTQRKRESRGYAYRNEKLQERSARKVEEDLAWLQVEERRLATLISRQDLEELLPEGMP